MKDVKDAVRTNLVCLVKRSRQEFAGGHPALLWLVKDSAAILGGCRRGPDGRTARELRKGRKFAGALPHIAENFFMIHGFTKECGAS